MATTELQEARKALRKHLKTKGRGEPTRLARLIGCDLSLPRKWADGDRNPAADSDAREVLERECGIPPSWWRKPKKSPVRHRRMRATRLTENDVKENQP